MGYYFLLAAKANLYAPSHRQDYTYHGLCNTSRGEMAGMRNSYNDKRTISNKIILSPYKTPTTSATTTVTSTATTSSHAA